jgi:hypothetical protein
MCGTFVRENREVPCLPVRVVCGRPPGERCGGNPRMFGRGKSDQFVVSFLHPEFPQGTGRFDRSGLGSLPWLRGIFECCRGTVAAGVLLLRPGNDWGWSRGAQGGERVVLHVVQRPTTKPAFSSARTTWSPRMAGTGGVRPRRGR